MQHDCNVSNFFLQASERPEKDVSSQIHPNSSTTQQSQQVPQNSQSLQSDQPKTTIDQITNDLAREKYSTHEKPIAKKNRSCEDEELMSTSIFQKPRIVHHSSNSPNKERSIPSNTSLPRNVTSATRTDKLVHTLQNSVLEKATTTNSSSQSDIPEINNDKSINTLHHSAIEKSKVGNSSLSSNVPSELSSNESLSTLKNSTLGFNNTSLSTSTLKASQESSIRAALSHDGEMDPADSLASTVLSMAFTGKEILVYLIPWGSSVRKWTGMVVVSFRGQNQGSIIF